MYKMYRIKKPHQSIGVHFLPYFHEVEEGRYWCSHIARVGKKILAHHPDYTVDQQMFARD